MENEFVKYEQALALKELGFDEPCFGRYYYKESYPMLNPKSEETELVFEFGQYLKQTKVTILAPLYQQAFRWFREKYGYLVSPFQNEDNLFFFEIGRLNSLITEYYSLDCETYEEAELAAIVKLIEIVKGGEQ